MKPTKSLYTILALCALAFAGCSSDECEPVNPTPEDGFVEAPKCDETVTAVILGSRATSSLDESITDLTATRCDRINGAYTMVTYHGRNKAQKGMVQIVDTKSGTVKSELYFADTRVNYASYIGGVAYIGLDRKGSNKTLCGIACVKVNNQGKFDFDNGQAVAELSIYKVDGLSVNCVKAIEQGSWLNTPYTGLTIATGGNDGLGEEGVAGFAKFQINTADPTKLGLAVNNMIDTNYRGYWVSFNNATSGDACMPVAYTYRTVDNGQLVYMVGAIGNTKTERTGVESFFDYDKPFSTSPAVAEVYRKTDSKVDLGRFGVSSFFIKGNNNGERFLIVSTGVKANKPEGAGRLDGNGGTRVYRYDQSSNQLVLVDVWDKASVITSNIVTVDKENYVYAAATDGVYKIKIESWKDEDGNMQAKLVPVAKRVSTVPTESETMSSTNYVQVWNTNDGTNGSIAVAGGYEGYYVLAFDDEQFKPADPRKDDK